MVFAPFKFLGRFYLLAAVLAQSVKAADNQTSTSGGDAPSLVQVVLHYSPSKAAAAITGLIYALISALLFVRIWRTKDRWGLCLPIGALASAFGYFLRIALAANPNSIGTYALMQMLVVCSPAAFLAFNYIVYGRLIMYCIGKEYSVIRPEIVARVFVISDVTTFLVQAAGGGLGVIKNPSIAKLANTIFLAGLVAQTLSYAVFIVLLIHAHRLSAKDGHYTGRETWCRVVQLLYFSSLFVMIRCIYRVVELAQGHGGFLLTHEIYFYLLDALPLVLAISIYIPFWPGNYMTAGYGTPSTAIKRNEEAYQLSNA